MNPDTNSTESEKKFMEACEESNLMSKPEPKSEPEEEQEGETINAGDILIQISSSSLRNLYSAYVFANQHGTFGSQSLPNQNLMMQAAIEAQAKLAEFDALVNPAPEPESSEI